MPRIGEQIWIGSNYAKAVYAGSIKIWPQSLTVTTSGSQSWTVPSWATSADVYALGGGGGGTDGGWLSSGSGGGAGKWGIDTWQVQGGETIKAYAGAGGSGNGNGAASSIAMGDKNCTGGAGTAGEMGKEKDGGTPSTQYDKCDDQTYSFPGGAGGTCKKGFWSNTITPGEAPGGGGGWGSTSSDKGAAGAHGQCWIVFRNCRKL